MKNRQQGKISLVILLSIISVFIVGCWDSRELSTLSLIAGLGFDLDPATKRATLTYQSIVPSQVKPSPSMGGGEGKQTGSGGLQSIQLDHDTGLSPYEVLNRYTQHGSRIPFYQHTRLLLSARRQQNTDYTRSWILLSEIPPDGLIFCWQFQIIKPVIF
jgi:spore germination protein KC